MDVLQKYLPEAAVLPVFNLIKKEGVHLKIVHHRTTKHGDYRALADGSHKITVNASLNPYQFLITIVHEIAHLVAFKQYGRRIKPHGIEWKNCFRQLMLPFLNPEVFPDDLLPVVAQHFKNPKASSDTDLQLALHLKKYSPNRDLSKKFIFELNLGTTFVGPNGKVYRKGNKRIKRFECQEINTGRLWLISALAEVEPLET
ncbi:MAG: SprT-like domain-containing protein [Flavobacteriaceae bacterium]|nr:SprT-like domain-containing protein [Flavobacteriaceae bacterium]